MLLNLLTTPLKHLPWNLDTAAAASQVRHSVHMCVVRLAVAADAEGVARVHVASWQNAYRGLLPDDYLDGLRWENRYEFWSGVLARPSPTSSRTWVLTSHTGIVGFASVGPARDTDRQSPGSWELYGIYLLPHQWGLGRGYRLLEKALGGIPASVTDVSLWVLVGNERARLFYERQGFTADGKELEDTIGGQKVVEVRYLRTFKTG